MKKFKKHLILLIFIGIFGSLFSQNLVKNPDFELGVIPSTSYVGGQLNSYVADWESYRNPTCNYQSQAGDIFDKRASTCGYSIPINKWSDNINTIDTKNRHVGIGRTELILGNLTEKILGGCQYELKLDANVSNRYNSGYNRFPCSNTRPWKNTSGTGFIEVYIAENNCSGNKLLIYSGSINSSQGWIPHSTLFTIPRGTNNYDRIIIQLRPNLNQTYLATFIDNVSIEKVDNSLCECKIIQTPVADGFFSSPHTVVQENSAYGLIDVAEFSICRPAIIDGSSSSCEGRWFAEISEFNLTSWSVIRTNYPLILQGYTSVPSSIDLRSFIPSPIIGKIYRLNLGVGNPWHSKQFFFKFKGASADGHFTSPHTIAQKSSKYGPIDVAEFCMCDPVIFDGTVSDCENRWFAEISEFNLSNWSSSTLYGQWQPNVGSSNVPSGIDIMSFFGTNQPIEGKVYRFNLGVGQPWHSKEFFFTFKCCNPPLDLGDDIIICKGDPLPRLDLSSKHPGTSNCTPKFTWRFNGGIIPITSPVLFLTGQSGGITPKAGTYTVEIVYPGCDTLRDTINLEIIKPICDINPGFKFIIKDCQVFFSNTSQINFPTTFVSYHWDFGDGNTSNVMDPIHTYTRTGIYNITLTVNGINNCGRPCSVTVTHTIEVECPKKPPVSEPESESSNNVTSISEIANDLVINLHPNPTNGMIYLDLASSNSDISLTIFDMQGRKIYKKENLSNKDKLDLSSNESGVYLFKFQSGDDITIRRVVKN